MEAKKVEVCAAAHFEDQYHTLRTWTDRMFARLMVLQFVAGVIAALVISPRTWSGATSGIHIHVWAAVLLGGALTVLPVHLVRTRPGSQLTRYTIAVSQMLTSALFIHLTGGRIETHFHVFGSLAFLALYRDRNVLLTGAVVIIIDHIVRGLLWPTSVYGVATATIWRSLEHGAWVVFEMTILFLAIRQGIREMLALAERRARLEFSHQGVEREVHERTRELREAETRARAILETAADGILTFDRDGVLQTANPAAERIFGRTAERMAGRKFETLLASPVEGAPPPTLSDLLPRAGSRVDQEFLGVREDGSTFPLEIAISQSSANEFAGIARDISERKEVERMKTEFISTVSHELRTPLTSIRGSLGLLEGGVSGAIPDKAASLIEIALNNSNRLVRLVNDILDIEKIESGKVEFRIEDAALADLVREAVTANSAFAEEHGVRFEVEGLPADTDVRIDRDRILQVLTNLLSNAAKFSPGGSVVTVSVRRRMARIEVTVADDGPGIPAGFRDRIFDKFAQADSSDRRKVQGSGLGLSISKAIVETHGGEIGFRDNAGGGTVFFFHLPASVRDVAPADADDAFGPRILVCEDDPDVAHLLALMLRDKGIRSDIAPDAAAVHALLDEHDYDAMTLDLKLPGVDGLDLLRQLRGDAASSALPIVVVSAIAAEGRRRLDHDSLGVLDWIEKPIDQRQLMQALSAAMGRKPSDREAGAPARVLHVEDNSDVAYIVGESLAPIADVKLAPCLRDARRLVMEQDFDLILLDLDLPDGSGLELVDLLRADHTRPPVVVFSAHDPGTKVEDQVSATLLKSKTDMKELVDVIASLVRHPIAAGTEVGR